MLYGRLSGYLLAGSIEVLIRWCQLCSVFSVHEIFPYSQRRPSASWTIVSVYSQFCSAVFDQLISIIGIKPLLAILNIGALTIAA